MSDLVPQMTDITAELAETGLDACLNDGIAKDLPLIATAIGLARLARTVRDRMFMRDVVRLIRDAEKVPAEKREAFLANLASNPKEKARLQDCIVRFVLQADDQMKVDIFARIFRALVAGIISQESFMRLSLAIRQVYAPDLAELREPSFGSSDSQAFQNCVSSGLTFYRDIDRTKPLNRNIFTPRWHLTALGKDFVEAISYEEEPSQRPEGTPATSPSSDPSQVPGAPHPGAFGTKMRILPPIFGLLLSFFAATVSGCLSIDQKGVVGCYAGERSWSCWLMADSSFFVLRDPFAPDTEENCYRGRWELEGSTLILRRNDGGVERMKVERHLGVLSLKPQRSDQPILVWEKREPTI